MGEGSPRFVKKREARLMVIASPAQARERYSALAARDFTNGE